MHYSNSQQIAVCVAERNLLPTENPESQEKQPFNQQTIMTIQKMPSLFIPLCLPGLLFILARLLITDWLLNFALTAGCVKFTLSDNLMAQYALSATRGQKNPLYIKDSILTCCEVAWDHGSRCLHCHQTITTVDENPTDVTQAETFADKQSFKVLRNVIFRRLLIFLNIRCSCSNRRPNEMLSLMKTQISFWIMQVYNSTQHLTTFLSFFLDISMQKCYI